MNKHVKVGSKIIGEGGSVFIVVELGVTHEQNVDLAKHFVEVAKKSGADAVKVEAFNADEFGMDKTLMHSYGTTAGMVKENYCELVKRLELKMDQIIEIKKKADECSILFFSTVHSKEDVDIFHELGVCAYKVGSGDMTHLPLIEYLCDKGKPIFMDTGAAYLEEVDRSVRIFEKNGFDDLILMHNPSGYPAPVEKTDLCIIPTLQSIYDLPVGLSCHTPGMDMVVASVAIGANVIEKPITRDNTIRGPEHIFAFLDSEADLLIQKVRNTEICLGNKRRIYVEESAHARRVRRGIYAKHDLQKDHVLSEEDIIYRIPNKGIKVDDYEKVLGRTLKRAYRKHEPLQFVDLE